MFDYLALFEEYLTVELGLAQNTRLAYLRDLRLLQKTFNFKSSEELLGVNRQQLLAYLVHSAVRPKGSIRSFEPLPMTMTYSIFKSTFFSGTLTSSDTHIPVAYKTSSIVLSR